MTPFGNLLHNYSQRILRGSSSSILKIEKLWPQITEQVIGVDAGRPYKFAGDTLFVECSSSEELSRIRFAESQIVLELQKEVSKKITRLYISIGKKNERT